MNAILTITQYIQRDTHQNDSMNSHRFTNNHWLDSYHLDTTTDTNSNSNKQKQLTMPLTNRRRRNHSAIQWSNYVYYLSKNEQMKQPSETNQANTKK